MRQRLNSNAQIQESDIPAEEPQALIAEFAQIVGELIRQIQQINATNMATKLDTGVTLADALAERDVLKLKHSVYSGLAKAANPTQLRYSLQSSGCTAQLMWRSSKRKSIS